MWGDHLLEAQVPQLELGRVGRLDLEQLVPRLDLEHLVRVRVRGLG